jgi:nucleoside-diphosphate-sugar epimerase
MSVVLVTGGSGFIASYCILQLLAAGHQVGTTVRSLKRESDVRAMLKQGGAEPGDRLKFFAAELEQDAGWREAVTGCDYVLHVASPLSQHVPKNEDEMIVPARDGTLRVLRAARDAGVKRVVLTSSSAAISYGRVTTRPIGRMSVAAMCTRMPNRRRWPSARPGILLRKKAVPSNSLSSIRFWCSVRYLTPTIRPGSFW